MVLFPGFKKTRIAPTPSGYLHLGNVLSFAITAFLARKCGAKILLRIDDLDRERVQTEYVQDIFDTLNFLEIPWDEGPRNMQEYEAEYSQMHRLELYRKVLNELKEGGKVFACACSRTQVIRESADGNYLGKCRTAHIPYDAPDTCWRLDTSQDRPLSVTTLQGVVSAQLPASMQYFVVRKKDGLPAYQLASVVDDVHFGIDLVVRGQDLWDSTLAQLYLASVAGQASFMDTTFYHHPLLMDQGNQKLSKSAGAVSLQYLRKEGKSRSDIFSAIARMMGVNEAVGNWEELGEMAARLER
jgi:glutamyl-tRNA synthetase